MRQKITWFIPGLLVTLLLGLLWAMPAFGQEAGSVEFLNASGGKAVSHVSLNGPAAGASGFWLQITDSDLDKVVTVKHVGTGITGDIPSPTTVGAPAGSSWYDLQNLDTNATIDSRDIQLYSDVGDDNAIGGTGTAGDEKISGGVTYNAAAGSINVSAGGVVAIEYKVKTTEVIGARVGANNMQKLANQAPGSAGDPIDVAASVATTAFAGKVNLLGASPDWLDILASSTPSLKATKFEDDEGADTAADDNLLTKEEKAVAAVNRALSTSVSAFNMNSQIGDNPDTTETETDYEFPNFGQTSDPLTVTIDANDITVTDDGSDDDGLITAIANITISNTLDGEEVVVRTGQTPQLIDTDTTLTAAVVVEVDYVGTDDEVYDQGVVGSHSNRGNHNAVTIQSNNYGPISIIMQETGSTTGVFGVSVQICDASDTDTCELGQEDETDGDGALDNPGATSRQVNLPVSAAGDTIRVAYRDASPSTTQRGSISLDVNPPALSNFAPESGAAGADDEPEIAFDVVDSESGISAFDKSEQTPNDSIQAVVALYETDGTKFAGPVTFMRADLSDDDEITGGFSAGFEVREGSSGDLVLDNGDKSQYEIRWWAVAMDQSGNAGVSDQKSAVSLTGTVMLSDSADPTDEVGDGDLVYVHGTDTKFNDEIKPGDTITVGVETRIVTDSRQNSNTRLQVEERFKEGASAASATTGDCIPTQFLAPEGGSITMAGCNPNVIRVDTQSPTMTGAITGTVLGDDDKPEAANSLTSIQVTFDEALDCETVTADDFEVDGAVPNAVNCFGSSVYLSVDEMDRDAKPEVELVGAVMDKAGNPLDSEDDENLRTQDASDGIGASITATVIGTGEGDRPITDRTVTVMVSSDERLASSPTVEIRKVGDNYSLGNAVSGNAVPTGNANEWAFERNFNAAGLYNVYVSGTNVSSATSGSADGISGEVLDKEGEPVVPAAFSLSKDGLSADGIILFEVDTGVSSPDFEPADDATTDNPDVFVRIDFSNEGKEYGLEAPVCRQEGEDDQATDDDGKCAQGFTKTEAGVPSTVAADIAADFDTSGTVEVTKATFNGEDVTESVSTRDSVLFIFRPGSLTLGDHKLEIEAMDVAGNEGKGTGFSTEFTVTERMPYAVELNPGPNLVSFPAEPADGDINAVFGGEGNEDVMTVLSFNNTTGLWQTAMKGADGTFSGDLTSIDGMSGYWVVSDSVLDVSVVLKAGTDFQPPPHIAVQEGWNLIGVVDADQAEAGTEILARDYFANIMAEVVYGYDSVAAKLIRISVGELSTDNVETGAAYWVYANEAGIIVP